MIFLKKFTSELKILFSVLKNKIKKCNTIHLGQMSINYIYKKKINILIKTKEISFVRSSCNTVFYTIYVNKNNC